MKIKVITFFQGGIYKRQEDAENSMSLFHTADLIKIASINALPNGTAEGTKQRGGHWDGGLKREEVKGTTLAKSEV